MLPAARWVIGAALVTPVALAAIGTAPVAAGASDDSSTSASPTVSSPAPTTSATPFTPEPEPSPTQTPASSPPSDVPLTISPEMAMESQLAALRLPTGTVDGVITPGTRRGMCVFRDLTGYKATRNLPTPELINRITTTTALPALPKRLRSVKALVNLTCQTAYITDGKGTVLRVLPVSTGKDLGPHATRTGFKRVYYKVNRWQRSTLFSEPDGRPGLYRPIYFDRGIAFHGVRKAIRTVPQSHGCVRTWPRDQDWLWNQLSVRDEVFVYGNYWRGKTASLGGYGMRSEVFASSP